MSEKKIGIVGATGYTGSELVRILTHHPEVKIEIITSESRKGERFSDVHPFLQGISDEKLYSIKDIPEKGLDLVFLALPHGVSMEFVKEHMDADHKIIDLSGDFRLGSADVYKEWYGKTHIYPEGFSQSVFGIPELFRTQIRSAHLVANPGCYPTGAILGLAPLVKGNFIKRDIIVDSKSGVTGAGVKPKKVTHFSNVYDNFKPYGIKTHRHTIEIQGTLNKLSSNSLNVQFTPHLLPVDRGIISTIYAKPVNGELNLQELYREFYADEPFIRIFENPPEIKNVRGTNFCDLYATFDERTGNIIVVTAIDNLVRGAAGQAVQNMNIMFNFDEKTGLDRIPLNP